MLFSLNLSAPGKTSDPGTSLQFLPATPGIQRSASRRTPLLPHVVYFWSGWTGPGADRAGPGDGGARSGGVSACIVLELALQPGPDPALHAAAEGPGQRAEHRQLALRANLPVPAHDRALVFGGEGQCPRGLHHRTGRARSEPVRAVEYPLDGRRDADMTGDVSHCSTVLAAGRPQPAPSAGTSLRRLAGPAHARRAAPGGLPAEVQPLDAETPSIAAFAVLPRAR